MNTWSLYWLLWFLASFVTFVVPETIALVTGHSENTLSSNIWRIEDVVPGQWQPVWLWTAGHYLVGFGLGLVLIWLFGHFLFGLWA